MTFVFVGGNGAVEFAPGGWFNYGPVRPAVDFMTVVPCLAVDLMTVVPCCDGFNDGVVPFVLSTFFLMLTNFILL